MPANSQPETHTFGPDNRPRVCLLLEECERFARETLASACGSWPEHEAAALAEALYAKFASFSFEEGEVVEDMDKQLCDLKRWLKGEDCSALLLPVKADKDDRKRKGILKPSRFHPYRSATEPSKGRKRVSYADEHAEACAAFLVS